ncbi:DeoR/GlpR family DNA-binding transcription regulator [Micromonospora sp. DR5-3]|uniref:DeoR/GlpR family DNA-binding transcription regulator n=1 Tax=unclassified Micromonospora TaxID=2617518 RepID=UPI0011D3A31F|nr:MULTISPECIES: DeoR/GlpR family DNA-binding transcription regulator [unclassified Micromonospora]MCW3813947.1 DeoR/GlpR family DNA-binding transcription regulator [Micromonospora sp. DR5-3]TYC24516.1 DeoR/GlpR transcriptional regulator [Micromonospora sp. MP36]
MDAAQRRHHILTLARHQGEVDVQKLAADLGVAPETIRRDLSLLAQHGLVRRTHGGAYPVETARFETTLETRTTRMVAEKRRIAAAAVEHLGDAESIFIDEGYTPQLIAEALPTRRPLTVVTASLPTAAALAHSPTVTVLLLGGRVRGRTLATVDHWATAMLAGFVIDLAFVGANGISREHGLTTPDPAVAAVKAQAVGVARRVVFAGVHTKFGGHSFCRFADVADVDTIVTDTALPASEAHRYSLLGPVVLRV